MPEEVGKEIMAGNTQVELIGPVFGNKRLIRAQKNPMDRCTIVSIFPKEIDEVKHTIEPGKFHIDPGSFEKPAILVVGSSSWWKAVDEQPLEIPNSSIQVANSVIADYCSGLLGCNMADLMPGLFFVLGEHTVMEIKLKFTGKLKEVKEKQDNWYRLLVKLADSLWARSSGNPLVISDEMRLAAKSLGLDKPWIRDFAFLEKVPCKACGAMKNPDYPVCQMCKSVDLTHPLAKDLKFSA